MKKGIITLISISLFYMSSGQEISQLKPGIMKASFFTEAKTDFRVVKLENAIAQHEAQKPQDWNYLVELVKSQKDDYSKVAYANLIANQIPYIDGTDGSYFSPLKGIKRGGVVCKDYAMFKYFLLKEAGYPIDKMALLVHQSVENPKEGAHVVLIVDIDDELWIANQFWRSTSTSFYKEHSINPAKFSKQIKTEGVSALMTVFDVQNNKYNEASLTRLKDYRFPDRLVLSILNENGVMNSKLLDTMKTIKSKRKLG